jgi:hypothetical protein
MKLTAKKEDGAEIKVDENAIALNTYQIFLDDFFEFEGVKTVIKLSESEIKQIRFLLLYSQWAETKSSGNDIVDQLKKRIGNYLKDCAVSFSPAN